MKLKEFDDVFNGDIFITTYYHEEENTITVIPIGNMLRGIHFIMNLTIRKIEINFDNLGAVVFVDIPPEIMPGLIACNNNDSFTLEKDIWGD